MKKLYIHNFPLKVLSIVLAVFLWFYVGAEKNPIVERYFEVPVYFVELEEGLSATLPNKSVSINTRGRQDKLYALTADDFVAEINLRGAAIGDNMRPVLVSGPAQVEVVEIRPSQMTVHVDKMDERTIPLGVQVTGKLEEGYSHEVPTPEVNTVTVTGAASVLNTIAKAQVDIDLTGLRENLVADYQVRLYNEAGEAVSEPGLGIRPERVKVTLVIKNSLSDKAVELEPVLEGKVASGYRIKEIKLDPTTVVISALPERLMEINHIRLSAVSIEGLEANRSVKVKMILPDGVIARGGQEVLMSIVIVPDSTSTGLVEQTAHLSVAASTGEDVKISPNQVNITCEVMPGDYTAADLAMILAPYVETDGLSPGTYDLPVLLKNTADLRIVSIAPQTVSVTLK